MQIHLSPGRNYHKRQSQEFVVVDRRQRGGVSGSVPQLQRKRNPIVPVF